MISEAAWSYSLKAKAKGMNGNAQTPRTCNVA